MVSRQTFDEPLIVTAPLLLSESENPASTYPVAAGLCYNLAAVDHRVNREPAAQRAKETALLGEAPLPTAGAASAYELQGEYALRYCPVCSQRLESRRCKLICNQCGYYMSCADYI
jgi:hypothetical protein